MPNLCPWKNTLTCRKEVKDPYIDEPHKISFMGKFQEEKCEHLKWLTLSWNFSAADTCLV